MITIPSDIPVILAQAMDDWCHALPGGQASGMRLGIYFPSRLVLDPSVVPEKRLCAVWPSSVAHQHALPYQPSRDNLVESGRVSDVEVLARTWSETGVTSYIRVSVPVPAYQSIDFLVLTPGDMNVHQTSEVVATTLRFWGRLKIGLRAHLSPLNPREAKCLAHAFAGHSAKETAQLSGLSERSVASYIQSAMSKLGTQTKLGAVQWAGMLGHF